MWELDKSTDAMREGCASTSARKLANMVLLAWHTKSIATSSCDIVACLLEPKVFVRTVPLLVVAKPPHNDPVVPWYLETALPPISLHNSYILPLVCWNR